MYHTHSVSKIAGVLDKWQLQLAKHDPPVHHTLPPGDLGLDESDINTVWLFVKARQEVVTQTYFLMN